jgi:hypothetical protein
MINKKFTFALTSLFVLIGFIASAQTTQPKSTTSLVDASALTLTGGIYGNIINGQNFQQDAIISYKNWQYIAYYDSARNVCIGRRKLPSGTWEIIRLTDYYFSFSKGGMNDAHNTISMGICTNDGTIHLAFDHHASPLHYRVSRKGILNYPATIKWESSLFEKVTDALQVGKPIKSVTYPVFVSTPQGNLILGFRTGGSNNGDYQIQTYDGKTSTWNSFHQISSGNGDYQDPFKGVSPTRNAYINGLTFDKRGWLHVSWTWREKNEGIGNRDIGYAYSKDNGATWLNSAGEMVASQLENKVINTDSKNIVIKTLNRSRGMMNSQSQAIDQSGIAHIVMYHRPENTDSPDWAHFNKDAAYFHYYRKPDGTWATNKTALIGNRPKLVADKQNNLYLVYVKKDHFDSKNQTASLAIAKATAKTNWTDWKEIFTSAENYFNEPQLDFTRFEKEHIISVMAQDGPGPAATSSALKVLDVYVK